MTEKTLTAHEMRVRKISEYLETNQKALANTLNAIKCYEQPSHTKTDVPKGLFIYRNELEALIAKQIKELKFLNGDEATKNAMIQEELENTKRAAVKSERVAT